MKAPQLLTNNLDVMMVQPDIKRDASLSVQWLEGDLGRETLTLMGVTAQNNKPSTLEAEQERIKDFIEDKDQLNWMVQYQGKIVGAVWVDLKPTDVLPAPAMHIMIGDPATRGKGVGSAALGAVINYLKKENDTIYSRYLASNTSAAMLLGKFFRPLSEQYTDADNLTWQNVQLQIQN